MAAGFAGLLAFGPARADAPRAYGLGCAGASYDRLACRHARVARRHVRTYRAVIAEPRLSAVDPGLYAPSRYASLLILGVSY